MDKKNLMPNQANPINRITAGQLPPELAELSEEILCSHDGGDIAPSSGCFACVGVGLGGVGGGNVSCGGCFCSYDGDDAE
ncbi:microcyclamide/patellamide family RiPP [Leptolyngbyaceae cyanobacterium CCMR0082]|uniref:Microcyclamide/patellamide family RiPP n=1 Tax=Adonisia turfae CCMR0082 TaxID=2304604 RepID=A0A6M0S793_9CYAN|nr:DUF5837 family cyanobactin class RiPP [Adonisia turfae]MDV3353587.1 DUF5837 family protein [Leptothoe sp. LEGE 181152]NEZ63851.1 microcyclamide/patellamide family RiPP [Adonisia turfae CCMR0082]